MSPNSAALSLSLSLFADSYFLKLMIVIFATVQLSLIILWASNSQVPSKRAGLAAAILSFVTSLIILPLSSLEHGKTLRPSMLLNLYLFVTLIFDAAILRTLWLSPFNMPIRGLFTASFCMKFVLVAMEAIEKRQFFRPGYEKTSPEESSGLFGQSLLWWLNHIIALGARQLIKPADLYPITTDMASEKLGVSFWKIWNDSREIMIRFCDNG